MLRPYSDVEPAQIEKFDFEAAARASKISRAIVASRNVFDISPGQVCSLRAAPLIRRMRDGDAGSFCRRSAVLDPLARFDPVDRQIVVRIGVAWPALRVCGALRESS